MTRRASLLLLVVLAACSSNQTNSSDGEPAGITPFDSDASPVGRNDNRLDASAGTDAKSDARSSLDAADACTGDCICAGVGETYAGYTPIAATDDLKAAIEGHTCVHIELSTVGTYTIDNPITIDTPGDVVIHGLNRVSTALSPMNKDAPLFVVRSANRVNFSGMYFNGPVDRDNYAALSFENVAPLRFEMQDAQTYAAAMRLNGPGSYRFQGVFFRSCGTTSAGLTVDHPQADAVVVGGNAYQTQGCTLTEPDYHHFTQKQGRLRIFDVGTQGQTGTSDIQIQSASTLGPHQIAYVRSEGTNGYHDGVLGNELLGVPATGDAVDVVVVANTLKPTSVANRAISSIVDYNGAGTLWMVANNSTGSNTLVKGTAPSAHVTLLGNYIAQDVNTIAIQAATVTHDANMYYYCQKINDGSQYPCLRNLAYNGATSNALITDSASIPPPLEIPPPLTRPVLDTPLTGMLNVHDQGAVGDGVTDDTAAIQSAFDQSQDIYFPPGTYRITSTLNYAHRYPSGWIAGAGSGQSIIKRDFSQKGGVFITQGFAYMTIQGLTFQTAPYVSTDTPPITAANFDIEFTSGQGPASSENMFYDCVFDGGYDAYAVGIATTTMGSENLYMGSLFKNAARGVAIGSYNALNNFVYGSSFDNLVEVIGHDGTSGQGGTFGMAHVNATNIRGRLSTFTNSVDANFLFDHVTADVPSFFEHAFTSARFSMYFDNSTITSTLPLLNGRFLYSNAATAIAFVHSATPGPVSLNASSAANAIMNLHSTIQNWSASTAAGTEARLVDIQ